MIKNNKKNAITKTWFMFTQFIMVTPAFTDPYIAPSSNCDTPATLCDIQTLVSEGSSHLAPVPSSPLARVSIAVTSVTNIVPSVGIGAVAYNYTVTNTLRAVAINFINSFTISCTASPAYQIYNGGLVSSGSSAIAATFNTGTAGTTCPFGTAGCGTPTAITLTMATANTVVTATDTNYNKVFTSTNTGWNAYVTGYYTCTYTDPNVGTTGTIIVPWGQGS